MSTKTLRKRIALATVVALGAGIFSATAAHATAGAVGTDSGIAGTGQTIYANGTDGVGASGLSAASVGLLASSVSNGVLAQTATLLATGKIAVGNYIGTTNTVANIKVTGGIIVSAGQGSGATSGSATPTVSGTGQASASAAATSSKQSDLTALIAPNAGATSMSISIYDGATTTDPVANIVVTIASSSAYNTFSAAKTTVYWGTGVSGDTALTDATSTNSNKADGSVLAGYVTLKDAYGNSLSAATGLLTATATTGAVVDLSQSSAGVGTVAYSASGSPIAFNVRQATAHAGWNGTVSFAWNCVVFATKSGSIAGEVAKVAVTASKLAGVVGTNNSTSAPLATIAFYDGAGNSVYPSSGVTSVSTTLGTVVSAVSVQRYPDSTPTSGVLNITGANKGTATGLKVQIANPSGTIVTSNAFDVAIGGTPDTYTASWDQATYKPGNIATLTIKVIDSKGNPASGYTALGSTATDTPTIANAPGAAVTAPAYGDFADSGVGIKTYKFVVSVADGTYSAVVSLPSLDAVNGSAQTATYTVASGGTSLNDVLKGIVSLIASINKQIAALAKLVTKKK
jgi:hypothetical protein